MFVQKQLNLNLELKSDKKPGKNKKTGQKINTEKEIETMRGAEAAIQRCS